MGTIVYLGLGSNVGDRQKNIAAAVSSLKKSGLIIHKISTILETDPVGDPAQGKFLNAALKAETDRSPKELLREIHKIEKQLGRVRAIKNGPRTIDIDILLFDRLRIQTSGLTIPHPRMLERDFVMIPLKEIEPDLEEIIPDENHSKH